MVGISGLAYFITAFCLAILFGCNAENPSNTREQAKLREKLHRADKNVEICLASLGIAYDEPCDADRIANVVGRMVAKAQKTNKMTLAEEELVARVQCRSWPHVAKCENQTCICTIYPSCSEVNSKPRPETCATEESEYTSLKYRYLKLYPANRTLGPHPISYGSDLIEGTTETSSTKNPNNGSIQIRAFDCGILAGFLLSLVFLTSN